MPAPCPPFNHREAYCLLLYVSDDGNTVETLWNSRDGVTPFIIGVRGDETPCEPRGMKHELWGGDAFAPFHVPNIGDRIFVDLTEERARDGVCALIARQWDAEGELRMRDSFPDKATAEAALVESWMKPGAPDIVDVDTTIQRTFLTKRQDASDRKAAQGGEPKLQKPEGVVLAGPGSVPHPPPARNDPCPCGSGKKWKRCHGGINGHCL